MAKRKTYQDLITELAPQVTQYFPWDIEEKLALNEPLFILDVRETHEYAAMHIKNSINVPRGIIETSIEWDHEETVPELVLARDKQVLVVCRSGSRSIFVTHIMQQLGFSNVSSLKTGLKGWNEFDLPLQNNQGNQIDPEDADVFFFNKLKDSQKAPHSKG